jgi:hypothetical protein
MGLELGRGATTIGSGGITAPGATGHDVGPVGNGSGGSGGPPPYTGTLGSGSSLAGFEGTGDEQRICVCEIGGAEAVTLRGATRVTSRLSGALSKSESTIGASLTQPARVNVHSLTYACRPWFMSNSSGTPLSKRCADPAHRTASIFFWGFASSVRTCRGSRGRQGRPNAGDLEAFVSKVEDAGAADSRSGTQLASRSQ